MIQTLEYIEAYFENTLSQEERVLFEQRCVNDEAFAKEVAFYITSREAVRQALLEKKKKQWASLENESGKYVETEREAKVLSIKRWIPYVVAASLLIAVAVYFLFNQTSPQQLAQNYINTNLIQIGQTMGDSGDSIQSGIAAYNNKDYDQALKIFENVFQADPQNSEVLKYTGLTYLMKKDYDKALQLFDQLSVMNLYSNPGMFLKAVTLLERNKGNDKEEAKRLLQQVVADKKEGASEAEQWLDEW